MASGISADAEAVLRLLASARCVLIGGVPAAGKTRLMNEVREIFAPETGGAVFNPDQPVVVPDAPALHDLAPSKDRPERFVRQTAMSPTTRFRQFWRDLEPEVAETGYRISEGLLYQANEFASDGGASLVIVDELNRGPAVEVFGGSIVAIEGDKRLGPDGKRTPWSVPFQLADGDGVMQEYLLSPHLYLLASMNRADVSAEALDGAFLRRWADYNLYPREDILTAHFDTGNVSGELPSEPSNPKAIYAAAIQAWGNVNAKLRVGISDDFQIGHGVLMRAEQPPQSGIDEALAYIAEGWAMIERHVREVLFGNDEAIADALYVSQPGHPYKLQSYSFAGTEVLKLDRLADTGLYTLLRVVAGG